jgi:deferrochelatase/peroxidase EfeB
MSGRRRSSFDADRRRFLRNAAGGAAVAAVGGPALLAACSDGSDASAAEPAPAKEAEAREERTRVEFHGQHQAGVLLRAPEAGIVAAFNSQANDRAALVDAFRSLSSTAQELMDGEPPEQRSPGFPPNDSGVFGDALPPSELSIIVGVGASLFDARYGLADRKPRELVKMPFIANDRLDPALSHGDLSITISAGTADMTNYALRQLMRRTRGAFTLRWMLEGFNTIQGDFGAGFAPGRNLLGFKDGTANPDAGDDDLMDELVWVGSARDEPGWARGGTYQAIRVIRMFVEFWDRTRLSEQEALIGRHKLSGAPLGGDKENDRFDFSDDKEGERVPLDAHIRLANPRTKATDKNRILRRGFSYSRGFDDAGRLDQGLLFSAFQSSLNDGFLAVQQRLKGEPLEEYILPVGGGFFYVLPGVESKRGYLGEGLLA